MWIQILLVVAVIVIGLFLARPTGGDSHLGACGNTNRPGLGPAVPNDLTNMPSFVKSTTRRLP